MLADRWRHPTCRGAEPRLPPGCFRLLWLGLWSRQPSSVRLCKLHVPCVLARALIRCTTKQCTPCACWLLLANSLISMIDGLEHRSQCQCCTVLASLVGKLLVCTCFPTATISVVCGTLRCRVTRSMCAVSANLLLLLFVACGCKARPHGHGWQLLTLCLLCFCTWVQW